MNSDQWSVVSEETASPERRFYAIQGLEIREAQEPGEVDTISGYAAVFDSLSEDLGGFREKVARGAFARSVQSDDVRALWDHDSKYVLGRTRAGTLELAEDDRGLKVVIYPPETIWAADLRQMMLRGDVNQMSFGFFKRLDEWEQTDGGPVRTLKDVDLFDVSIVTYPAYPQTSAEARDAAGRIGNAWRRLEAGEAWEEGDESLTTNGAAGQGPMRQRRRIDVMRLRVR